MYEPYVLDLYRELNRKPAKKEVKPPVIMVTDAYVVKHEKVEPIVVKKLEPSQKEVVKHKIDKSKLEVISAIEHKNGVKEIIFTYKSKLYKWLNGVFTFKDDDIDFGNIIKEKATTISFIKLS